MRDRDVLATWAEVAVKTGGVLGYDKSSPIAERKLMMPRYHSINRRLPTDVTIPGMSAYLQVENAVDRLGLLHRMVLVIDQRLQDLFLPCIAESLNKLDLGTSRKRATALGISESKYHRMLNSIVEEAK